uniref:GOLD domain-containing protein n=1 Tax=Elaeophora elaphi TaxID=1147741 RepID=A0A0R3RSB1_9BILA
MLIVVLFLTLLCSSVRALYFHIAETERKCFIEEIPDETTVIGNYKVMLYDPNTKGYGEYPRIGMHVEVKDPEDKIILSKLYTSEGRFTFTSHSPGEHFICLYSNSSSWFSGAQLRVYLDIQTGEHTQDYEQVAAKDKLNELQLRVRQLLDQVEQISKEQNYQRYREERFRQTSENTNSRVLWWSIAQTIVLLLTGAWQMRHLKGFFEAKKLENVYSKKGENKIIERMAGGNCCRCSILNVNLLNFSHGEPYDNYKFEHDLTNKTYIVVGASSGIGKETAKELAMRKAKVIMACRDNRKCIEARRNMVISTKNMDIYCRRLNLEDFDSIRDFVLKLDTGKGNIDRIDGIVYSAATVESTRRTNKHHIERTFATNHLGPFLLTSLLYDRLRKQSSPVRLVFLNTSDLKLDELNFDGLNSTDLTKWQKSPEKAKKDAYYQSKLALTLFVKLLSEKVKGTNLRVTMVDPGDTKTDLFYRLGAADGRVFFVRWCKSLKRWIYGLLVAQSISDATRPVLYALADEKMENVNGIFINSVRDELPWHKLASDEKILNKLWLTSAKWTETGVHLQRLQQDLKKPKSQETGATQELKARTGWFSWL